MSTEWILYCFLAQAVCYLLIFAYKFRDYWKNRDNKKAVTKKPKLVTDFVQAKRHRTPAEKISAWLDSAQFRVNPDPDVEIGFPQLQKLYFENIETPRLMRNLPGVPVIAQEAEMTVPNVVQLDNDDSASTSCVSSNYDPPQAQEDNNAQ